MASRQVTLTINRLISAIGALQVLTGAKLPGATALKLSRVRRQIEPEMQAFEDQRAALAKQYGEPSADNPNLYQFPDEAKRTAFNGEVSALGRVEVTLAVPPINFEAELGAREVMSGDELLTVLWLFEDLEDLHAESVAQEAEAEAAAERRGKLELLRRESDRPAKQEAEEEMQAAAV